MVICLFTACSDDDDKMPQGPVITYAGKLPSNVNGYIFTYDENGRCIQVKAVLMYLVKLIIQGASDLG